MGDEWLEVEQGPAAGDRLDVGRDLSVGRAEQGPGNLGTDPQLSRQHARFWRAAGGQLMIEDSGSANGTFVNGERIDRPAVLAVGDTLQVGSTVLGVRGDQPTRQRPAPFTQQTGSYSGPPPGSGPPGEPPPGSGPPGEPSAGSNPSRSRLLRLLAVLVGVLVLAVVGLGVALAARGGTSKGLVANSTIVRPLFPVTGLNFKGELATFKSESTNTPVSATIDWGDGTTPTTGTIGSSTASGNGSFTRSVSGSHTYSRVATFAITVSVKAGQNDTDRASNLATVTNCFCVAKLPTFAHSVDLGPVSGRVLVRPPGVASFVPLTAPREIPVGSQLDATQGSLVVMAATAVAGKLVGGLFDGGVFQISQAQNRGGLVDLSLQNANRAGCPAANASPATQRQLGSRALGLLHASVNGSFRTAGKFSAATVRGTEWTTTEQCDGTLTRVQRGVVDVTDYRTGQTTAVSAGQTYLAKSTK